MRRPGTATLRRRIERRTKAYLWGKPHWIVPRLVDEVLGDGRQLVGIAPIMTRPNYYVVRVDSRWSLSSYDDGDILADHLDEILGAIGDQYGERERERYHLIEDGVAPERADLAYYPRELGWPVLCDEGVSWFDLDWPREPRRRRRAIKTAATSGGEEVPDCERRSGYRPRQRRA